MFVVNNLKEVDLEVAKKLVSAGFEAFDLDEWWDDRWGDWWDDWWEKRDAKKALDHEIWYWYCSWHDELVVVCDPVILFKPIDRENPCKLDEVEQLIEQAIATHDLPTTGDQLCLNL